MEEDNNSQGFRFNVEDDEIPELPFHAQRKSPRQEKPAPKGGIWFALFLFLIMCGATGFVYFDLKKSIRDVHEGATVTESLSQDLEAKFSAISDKFSAVSEKYETLESSLHKTFSPVEDVNQLRESIAALRESLKKTEQNMEKLRSAQSDKNAWQTAVAEDIEKNLAPVREALKKNETALTSLDEKFTQELVMFEESFQTATEDMEKLREEIAALPSESTTNTKKISQVAEYQQKLSQQVELLAESLENKAERFELIEIRLKELEKTSKRYKERLSTSKSDEEDTSDETPVHPIDTIKPKPGTFIEQNIE